MARHPKGHQGPVVCNRSPRRGLSLLEVLISIGVVAIGLFGVLALIPMAAIQMNQGLTEDRKSEAGKNWVAEFNTRGMARQQNWLFVDDNVTNWPFVLDPITPQPVFWDPDNPRAFAIDPRFVAAQQGKVEPVPPAPAKWDARRFPYVLDPAAVFTTIAMPRITLRRHLNGTGAPMPRFLADELFTSSDDLVFVSNDDEIFPPLQKTTTDGSKRLSAGTLSWMATLVPKQRGAADASDLHTLSVIVFHLRDPELRMDPGLDENNNPRTDEDNERLAFVDTGDFFSDGISGGDMRITALGTGQPSDVDVRAGNWVMLAGQYNDVIDPGPPVVAVTVRAFKWYRVIAADPLLGKNAANDPTRIITLLGPDWDALNMPTPQVTVMKNVVAVYEKTIRLETSSMWTQ